MWRDEAQKWLIATNLDFFQILDFLRYEGHPFLWYLLLYFLKLLGCSYESVKILNWIILSIGICIFYYKSPFPFWFKTFFIFSSLIAFEYAAISINYGIVVTLIFALAWCYPERHQRPILYSILLFLLYHSHVMAFAFSLGLTLIFILEVIEKKLDKRNQLAAVLMFVAAISLMYSLVNPSDSAILSADGPSISFDILLKGFIKVCDSTFWIFKLIFPWFVGFPLIIIGVLCIKKLNLKLLVLSCLVYYFLVNEYIYGMFFRHYGFVFCFFLFAWWQSENEKDMEYSLPRIKKYYYILITILLFHSSFFSIRLYQNEFKFPFSGSKDCATFINKQQWSDSVVLIGYPAHTFSAVLPYLDHPNPFWQPEVKRFGTYLKWDKEWYSNYYLSTEEVLSRVYQKFEKQDSMYLIISKDFYIFKLE